MGFVGHKGKILSCALKPGSAGVSPAVEAASRRLSVGEETSMRRVPGFVFDGADAAEAGETRRYKGHLRPRCTLPRQASSIEEKGWPL